VFRWRLPERNPHQQNIQFKMCQSTQGFCNNSVSQNVQLEISNLISNTVNTAWKNLLEELQRPGECVVPQFTFVSGQSPDYSLPTNQHLYILKYFPAYLFEYTKMYQEILIRAREQGLKRFNILSLGCGCGLDYYGLYFACKIEGIDSISVKYRGIDIVEWNYRNLLPQHPVIDCRYLNCGIEGDQIQSKLPECNIIVFPKSLSEFPPECFQTLQDSLTNNKPQLPVIIAASVMSDGITYDYNKLNTVASKIVNTAPIWNSFESNFFQYLGAGIASVWRFWQYPDGIRQNLGKLPEICCNENICEYHDCCANPCPVDTRNLQPILTHRFVQCRIGILPQ
jgi:hypothetical protein